MQKINVSVVSYSNSLPFVYGLRNSEIISDINLSLDIPSVCADKLLSGQADIGLIPIVELLRMKNFEIISDLCIGANDNVKTVILAANQPVEKLSVIHLDYQSRTSVMLIKVLAKHLWNIAPTWVSTKNGFENETINNTSGAVIIGDRTFSVDSKYRYDLAHEWKTLTNLPFVFAAWVTNKKLSNSFKERFNSALNHGINNLGASVTLNNHALTNEVDILSYLTNNISYQLDTPKKEAMNLFLDYAKKIILNDDKNT